MGRWVLWAGVSYGPVRLMGWCVLWAGKYGSLEQGLVTVFLTYQ
jgi:hypothetical protein